MTRKFQLFFRVEGLEARMGKQRETQSIAAHARTPRQLYTDRLVFLLQHSSFLKRGTPINIDPRNTIALIIGIPKKLSPIWETPT